MRWFFLVFALAAAILCATWFAARNSTSVASAARPDSRGIRGPEVAPRPDLARAAVADDRPRPQEKRDRSLHDGIQASTERRELEYAAKYVGRSLGELENAYAELETRITEERERLIRQRFEDGRFESRVIRSEDLAARERELAETAHARGVLCKSRSVYPDAASGGRVDGAFEFQTTCLSREDYPNLFALLDEEHWIAGALEAMHGADEDESQGDGEKADH